MMRAFIFEGFSGSSASRDTLRKRSKYGGRKGRRADKRLQERLTWTEVSARVARSRGSSTIYVDDRKNIAIPHALHVPIGASVDIVVPTDAEMVIG